MQFNKIVVIYNPASTNAQHFKRRVETISKLFPNAPISTVKTSPDGRDANRKIIIGQKKLLGRKSLLCIAAGDGTVNLVVETLLREKSFTDEIRRTPVLPLWGGNANDLGHMLNGYSRFMRLNSIFKYGQIIQIRPLEIRLKHEGTSVTRIAACYASFGATAFAADQINNPSHRKKKFRKFSAVRLWLELQTVVKAFIKVPRFTVTENNSQKMMYEYAFINGSRIAKFERIPIRLTDNAFYIVKLFRKHPVTLLYIFHFLRKQRFGRVTSNQRSFTILTPTWLQVDGEVIDIKANTQISITIHNQPFYALSRRLRNRDQ